MFALPPALPLPAYWTKTDPHRLFERGAEFVGSDFQAAPFWDKYIELEERHNETARVVKIHERLTHIPLYTFDRYYQKFRTFISSRPLEEITDASTIATIKAQALTENPNYPELELDRYIRAKLDQDYYAIFGTISQEVHKRWTFEGAIKRPYFHVTDVEEAELDNWRKYLDFEEAQGDAKRTAFLYERCLVACALYEEFWLRYARWMFAHGKDEDARIIYMKASCIFVPIAHPTVRLHWARFEEKLGRIQQARDIHTAILYELPNHVETIISLAGLERRHEGVDAAVQCLENYVNQPDSQIAGQLTAEQARILWQCGGDVARARKIFADRTDRFAESRDFWLSYLKFEMNQISTDEKEAHERIKSVYTAMRTKSGFPAPTLKELSQIYMAYLLERGGKGAAEEYMILDKELNGYVSSKKDAPLRTPASSRLS